MAFFPRLVVNEFAPMFRLMDDFALQVASRSSPNFSRVVSNNIRTYQPRFDVKENKESYELHGELPGISQKDINIEFTDATTLSIRGRTESVRDEGTQPAAVTQNDHTEAAQVAESETASTTSSGYHKATVEEDESTNMAATGPDATPAETPSESPAQTKSETSQTREVAAQQPKADTSRYWLSERTVGQFARTFSFPSRVDHENVKASLKNGILSVVVPKAAAPVSRRIDIE